MRPIGLKALPIAMALLMAGAAILAWARPKTDWDSEAAMRKAEYMYLESQNAYSQNQYGSYAALMRRAYELDSSDCDIAAEWGMITLSQPDLDSATMQHAYSLVKNRFFTDPTDYLTGIVVANQARRLHNFDDYVRIWEMLDSGFPSMSQPAQELAEAYLISYLVGDSAGYDKAMQIYQRLETGTGKNIGLSSQKIRAFALKQDTAAIVREVNEIVDFAPKDATVALFAGTNFQYIGDNQKALEYYSKACELDSTYGLAFMSKANLYNEMGDSAGFDREVFLALRSQSLDVEPKIQILRNYVSHLYADTLQEGRIRQLFGELEQMHSGEAEIHNLYASYLFIIRDYKGAAEEMTYSVALEPNDDGAWTNLIQMLSRAKDTEAVISYASQAFEKFPENLYYPIVEADAYRTLGDNKKALATVDSVEIKQIGNPDAVSNFLTFKADIIALNGDTIRALETYDQALDLDPGNLSALNNAAYFMAENNIDLDKAERYSLKTLREEPDNLTYLDTYSWVLFKKKDYTLAQQYIDMTINRLNEIPDDDPDGIDHSEDPVDLSDDAGNNVTADIYEHAGDIYFMVQQPDKSLSFWKKALKLDPDNDRLQRKVKHQTYFYE